MESLRIHRGLAALLDRANVDTDQIIPKQFLKKIERTGFGKHLFHDWRFLDDAGEKENPDFALNQKRYRNATILVTRENFGCGSSREHAPWALLDYGFRIIVAPSYADIFFNNCFKNGMLPIVLPTAQIQELFEFIEANEGAELEADLEKQELRVVNVPKAYRFEVEPFRRECLLNGWDDIGLTLRNEGAISSFEKKYAEQYPFQLVSK
ncbi:MAG: 3-isopropylmalate dehydratase small subunit [Leptonema illini]|jgi:3-isopropylmalate/(R)-2-methylmalate dehydratase small subunit|uniref:3-isopropylmalate dehydratase small subunit n=2 Tax=Leptonema illini TaxID=183 RepID=H2CKL9_9LEPT|nr:3-isopropylmalate dehydratase small subunit [Leptonema illini]EHQ05074.1 3-isopropylmalate dehydratase, small subunit [Leptonema illini DSM 21528]KAB2928433.1 MAG: 3-isopropylmalate dehydratase small subunit [Leptonema illini]